jgi:hypothetical protein
MADVDTFHLASVEKPTAGPTAQRIVDRRFFDEPPKGKSEALIESY